MLSSLIWKISEVNGKHIPVIVIVLTCIFNLQPILLLIIGCTMQMNSKADDSTTITSLPTVEQTVDTQRGDNGQNIQARGVQPYDYNGQFNGNYYPAYSGQGYGSYGSYGYLGYPSYGYYGYNNNLYPNYNTFNPYPSYKGYNGGYPAYPYPYYNYY